MTDKKNERPRAQLLKFTTKRGRPKSTRPATDTGTPELVMKRLLGVTAEALDLCLERGLISREQHWCGIHLRWLYTLRYGAPSVRAIDPSHFGGNEPKTDDPNWRIEREREYGEAISLLTKTGTVLQVVNLCIFNQRHRFLKTTRRTSSLELTLIQDGLESLAKYWRRKK